MATFQYKAVDNKGNEKKGILEGDSARQVRELLRQRGLTPLTVNETAGKGAKSQRQKLSSLELSLITRQLATLLAAGIPLAQTLAAVAKQMQKPQLKSLLMSVRGLVLEGLSLAHAMASYPKAFAPLYRATVAAGEHSGHLDQILLRLAEYYEQQNIVRQKIKQAMIYPVIMTGVSLSIVIFLMAYVVPKMISVFSQTGQALPGATQVLIGISNIIISYGIYILVALVALVFVFIRLYQRPEFKVKVHRLLLKVPILGQNILLLNSARFARTFGILTTAGISVLDAMRTASQLVTNIPMRESIEKATSQVKEGSSINRALEQCGYFQPMMIQLIASGEATGELDAMLKRAAQQQDSEVENRINGMLTLFEPVLILVMGGVVLFIVLAILLPIFSLDQFTG